MGGRVSYSKGANTAPAAAKNQQNLPVPRRTPLIPLLLVMLAGLSVQAGAAQTDAAQADALPGIEEQVDQILQLAEDKAEDFEVAQLFMVLARDERPDAAEALFELVGEFNGQLRSAAVSALGASLAPNRIALLGKLVLKSKQLPDRTDATRMLVRTQAGRDWLTSQYKKIKDDTVRAAVVKSLAESGAADEKFILKALKEKNPQVRAEALEAAALLGFESAAKIAIKAIGDGNQLVRRSAAVASARFGGAKAYRELCEALEDTNGEDLRAVFRSALKLADDVEEIEVLASAMLHARDDDDVSLFAQALESAGRTQPALAGPAFAELLERKEPRLRRLALRGIEATAHVAALPRVVTLLEHDDIGIRSDAVRALGRLPGLPPSQAERVVRLSTDPDDTVRLSATGALAMLPEEVALPALGHRLQDVNWAIRDAAVETLGGMRTVGALGLLADHMQRATGLVREEAYDLLTALTGEDFGPTPTAWSKWAQDLPPDYQLPSTEEAQRQLQKIREERSRTDSAYGSTSYHGLSVRPSNVVFILDVSGSMGFTYTPDARTFYNYFVGELSKTIHNLGGDHSFSLITFSGSAQAWRQELVEPTEANKDAAVSFMLSTRPWGATNLYHSLALAFQIQETQQIYLMTDGDPTAGAIRDKAAILDWVKEMNRNRRIRIHTIIAGDVDGDFIAELAALNGGTSVDLRDMQVD